MNDTPSMSVSAAAKQAKQHPNDASTAIQTLFDYVEDGGDEARSAAKALDRIASRAPDAFDGQTAHFARAIETTNEYHPRRRLVEAVNELVDQQAIPPGDAGRALTEATTVTPAQQYWEEGSKNGLLIINHALEGWANVAAMGEPVPGVIVEGAIDLIELEDFNVLLDIIAVLQAAVASGSPKTDIAFQHLVELTQVEDPTPTIKSEATLAVAKLVLSDDIPDEDTARDVITANADAVRAERQTVVDAKEAITA
jgi:hypothetical protein